MAMNNEQEGYISLWTGLFTSFLSYWNEDMAPIDGTVDYVNREIDPLLDDYFDWDLSEEGRLYVKSTIPQMPIIGYFTPVMDDHYYVLSTDALKWAGDSYNHAGMFAFPQMAFDADNKLHLVYLGLLDGGNVEATWKRQPFYTSTEDKGTTWTQTEYIVDDLELIDKEFAYLTLAGIGNAKMYLMAQVDRFPGTWLPYANGSPDHGREKNYYHFVAIDVSDYPAVNELTPFPMTLIPNPASGKVKVTFEGKGNITVCNLLGQTVYHVENVTTKVDIPLNNLTSGVYFVQVRSGNTVATQKLIVK
jgi:hypothetical protein